MTTIVNKPPVKLYIQFPLSTDDLPKIVKTDSIDGVKYLDISNAMYCDLVSFSDILGSRETEYPNIRVIVSSEVTRKLQIGVASLNTLFLLIIVEPNRDVEIIRV